MIVTAQLIKGWEAYQSLTSFGRLLSSVMEEEEEYSGAMEAIRPWLILGGEVSGSLGVVVIIVEGCSRQLPQPLDAPRGHPPRA